MEAAVAGGADWDVGGGSKSRAGLNGAGMWVFVDPVGWLGFGLFLWCARSMAGTGAVKAGVPGWRGTRGAAGGERGSGDGEGLIRTAGQERHLGRG